VVGGEGGGGGGGGGGGEHQKGPRENVKGAQCQNRFVNHGYLLTFLVV